MASTNLFLKVVIGWQEVTPDGSVCHGCGDACYLFMVQAFYQVEGQERKFVDACLCSSCVEIMRESPDAGEEWKRN